MEVGEQLTLRVTATGANGQPVSTANLFWSSSDERIATVTPAGSVTALVPGEVRISASTEGRSATSQISVLTRAVREVRVSPLAAQITIGETRQFTVSLSGGDGSTITGREVAWTTANASVATVDGNGVVRAVGVGTAIVRATSEGRVGEAQVTVISNAVARVAIAPTGATLQVNATQQFSATAYDAQDRVLTGRTVSWSISPASVATVSASGLVRAVAPGAAVLVAEVDGRQQSALVNVATASVASVSVSPETGTVAPNATIKLTATVQLSNGTTQPNPAVSWTTSNSDVAIVASDGLVRGVSAGIATITATSGGKSDDARITVTAGVASVARVTLSPTSASMQVGETQQFSATAYDAGDRVITGRPVSWSITPTSVATVSSSGLVRAVAPGTAVLTAEVDGRERTAVITVAAATVASVTLSPTTATIAPNGTIRLAATVRLSDGTTPTNPAVNWSTSDPDIAIVASDGLVRGVGAGTATITATAGGRSAEARITVTAPVVTVARVALTPLTASLQVGGTQQFTATAYDASDRVVTGRAVTWSITPTSVATVSSSGLVRGVAAGAAVVTAEIDGRTATGGVTVTAVPTPPPPTVASVEVSPRSTSVTVGGTVKLTATVRLSNGSTATSPTVSWSSSNTSVATVDGTGLVRGVAPGSATITASSGGQSDAASIAVTPAPIAALVVAPSTASVFVGATRAFTVTARDAAGNTVPTPTLTWSSSSTSIATISSGGVATGVTAGTTTITARAPNGVEGSAALTVAAAPTPSPGSEGITITFVSGAPVGDQIELDEGKILQLRAIVRNSDGNQIFPTVLWTSSDDRVASVTGSGLVGALRKGNARITARAAGQVATVDIKVEK